MSAPATFAVETEPRVVGGVCEAMSPPLAINYSYIDRAPTTEHGEVRGVPPGPHYVLATYNRLPVGIDAVRCLVARNLPKPTETTAR